MTTREEREAAEIEAQMTKDRRESHEISTLIEGMARANTEAPDFYEETPCHSCGTVLRWPAGLVRGTSLAKVPPSCPDCQRRADNATRGAEEIDRRSSIQKSLFAASKAPDMPPPVTGRYPIEFNAIIAGNRSGAVVYGPVGVGKTRASVELIKRWIRQRRTSAMYVAEGDMLANLRPQEDGSRDYLRRLQYAELLVLDDVGSRHATSWRSSAYFDVLDPRYASRRPTVILTNLPPSEFATSEMFDGRVLRRMGELGGKYIVMNK